MPWTTKIVTIIVGIVLATVVSARAAEYRIGPLDKLRIKVHEWPALTDEATISPEGTLTLPLIGIVKAEGSSVAELAQNIAARLQEQAKLPERPFASVEIVQFRPFYVTGDVQRPGEFPYRPGITVLMAISLSGGLYRGNDLPLLRLDRDAIVSDSSIAADSVRDRRLRIQQARIRAELAGKEQFDQELGPLAKDPQNASLIQEEKAIMQQRGQTLRNQIAGLRRQIEIHQDEIKFLRLQIDSSAKQKVSVEREMAGQRALNDKGLALMPRVATLERLASQIEGDQRGLETAIARARQNIAVAETTIAKMTDERDRDGRVELAQISRELEDVSRQIATQKKLAVEADALGAAMRVVGAERLQSRTAVKISRTEDNVVRTFPAEETDKLLPGDVVIIERLLDDGASPSSLEAPSAALQRGTRRF